MVNGHRIKNAVIGASIGTIDAITYIAGGKYGSLVDSYLHDVLIAPTGYFIAAAIVPKLEEQSILFKSSTLFGLLSAGEVAQAVGLYPGTFDPFDFLAYATGTSLTLGINMLTNKNRTIDDVASSPKS